MHRLLSVTLALLSAAPVSAQDAPPFDLAAALSEGPPMTADRAAQIALESSPSVERSRALSRMSAAAVSRARAAMLPRLELTARYAHIDGFPDGQIATGGDPDALAAARMLAARVSDPAARALWLGNLEQQGGTVTLAIPRDQIAFGARMTWPVSDLFFAMLPALEGAEAGARARALQLEASEAQIERSAREAFYQLARARGGLAVARQARAQAEAQRERIDAAVRAGFMTEADRLAAEARVASAERAIAMAEAGVAVADAALRAILGAADGATYGIGEPLLEISATAPEPLDELSPRALERRPELLAMRETLAAQRASARASDAGAYPHLALFAGADYASPNRYVIPPSQDFQPSWELGAVLSWAPNDALSAAHRGEELAAQYAATEAELAQLERMVRLEVRRAHATLVASGRSLEAARAALAAAEAAYESRDAQLRAGHATTADLFAAENALNRARLALLDAAVDHRLSQTRLRYAAGE